MVTLSRKMTPELLKQIILEQKDEIHTPQDYFKRTIETKIMDLSKNREVILMMGIRRCGKSVLLQKVRQLNLESDYYFNFEDERLINFRIDDFQLLQQVLVELYGVQKNYYFDEIQNISGWELFIRRLYNNQNKIYITGSNASLFNEKLGTSLTGRYIPVQIYPFSFYEFLNNKDSSLVNQTIWSTIQIGKIKNYFNQYYQLGGFPEYVKYEQIDYLQSLFEGILYRDIIARHKISHVKSIKELIHFLASNCSKEFTYNSLRKFLGVGSVSTISDYCHYLEDSYLCSFVNRYSESVKIQMQSPKKVYFVDHVLAKTIGFRFSEDAGRVLENIVYIELKRRDFEVYYYRENKECDFLVRKNAQIISAIQVCVNLSEPKTKQREIEGLLEVMTRYSLKEGLILTTHDEEVIHFEDKKINILPLWKWLILGYSSSHTNVPPA